MIDPISIVEQCYQRLPSHLKDRPWEVTDHGTKVPQTEDELNAYLAAYGEIHIIKCRAALQNLPTQDFEMYGYEIFDWGCGQGMASLVAIEFLSERNLLGRLQRITLIEPSELALSRAHFWIKHAIGPGVDIRCANKYIPNNDYELWDELDCKSRISINLFSNILDIRNISLHWLAHKTGSLANVNYMICVGPKFSYNTRIKDFCGYFSPTQYFSNIEQFPYAYTTKTKHPYGCETKCFVHKRSETINENYIEKAESICNSDDYDYAAECLRGVVSDDVIDCYNKIRACCGKTYDVFFRPNICTDVPDVVLAHLSHGIILLNVCEDIEKLEIYYRRIENIKSFLFSTHLKSIKIDSVINKTVYNSVKTALYFPKSSKSEVEEQIAKVNEKINSNRRMAIAKERKYNEADDRIEKKDFFEYVLQLYPSDDLKEILNSQRANGFKSDYYNELLSLIVGHWHSFKDGDQNFRLSDEQKKFVRSENKRLRVKGVAGCGKTQVVANRAVEQHLRTGDTVLILTFNISLIQYVRMRINQVPADFSTTMFEITNYHRFFKSMANRYADGASLVDYDNVKFFAPYTKDIAKYKTIIIDEAQDFKTAWFDSIINYFLDPDGSISIFGDGEQNIYGRELEADSKMPIIHTFTGRWNELSERVSMRILNPRIAHLSSLFAITFMDSSSQLFSIQDTYEKFYIKYWNLGTEKKGLEICKNINWIMQTYNLSSTDVVVMAESINVLRDIENCYTHLSHLQSMINFETLEQYNELKRKTKNVVCFDRDLEDIRRAAKTHFTTDCDAIKFSTIHSFKGWESKNVILLLQPEMKDDEKYEGYYIKARENAPALIYTAITRARNNLFIINMGNRKYDSFFKNNIR
ncbi:MAG: AAA family ATPase [Bacteroidaceae bacterium]|nr:AAA family ATPase [Bacteroidaceae bacterium]